ncbi:MAG: phenylalanine--tRNA ligase subunit beta [Clostridia bacterium]|nr:phenylalanine--tRNA ligase subunit beta [Clostridia bacterium]
MILSKRWLNDYCKIDIDDKQFAEAITLTGSKVEGWEQEGEELKNIVLGKISQLEKHPDSDHLWVCQVDIGAEEPVQIVTGAQNLKVGDYVPAALHKSVVAGGQKITKGKLRGVMSNGMLCSVAELGLTVNDFPNAIEDGIMTIGEECDRELGKDIREVLRFNDTKIEFEITSNRSDCMSVTGLARETAATFDKKFEMPKPIVNKGHGDVNEHLKVSIHNPDLCYRYIGAVVENVRIKPSPLWLRERLRASGVRPINNIVDITNFVMLEWGQPMHAFDLRYLEGNEVNVRTAKAGESITTLDGEERALSEDMLVIADAKKPVAVAGVMGGEYSGIMEDTTTIVFESACFNGYSVRSTAKALGMRTESSSRYEKELNPESCMLCIMRALELLQMLDAGDVVNGMIDVFPTPKPEVQLPLDAQWINNFIGIDLSEAEMVSILEKIGFTVKDGVITAPYFRNDIEHQADIAEEIARFYGFEKIPNKKLTGVAEAKLTEKQQYERLVENSMRAMGYSEINTFSFISPKAYDKILLPADSELRNSVVISNPLGEDTSVMRTTAIPSMLEVIARNYNYRTPQAKFYENATVYKSNGLQELPTESKMLTFGAYGGDSDFYSIKGAAQKLLDILGIEGAEYTAYKTSPTLHPGRSAKIAVGDQVIGVIGEVHPNVCKNYKLGAKTYIGYFDSDALFALKNTEKLYHALPKFPALTRDLALVCDKQTEVAALEKAIKAGAGKMLEKVELFDIFEGVQIGIGKKSVAFSLTLRSPERTLTDTEADSAVQKALDSLKQIGVQIRS